MEDNFQIDSAAISDRGLSEKRPHNEDSFLLLGDRGVFAVADGVGGAQAGDVASQMAVEIIGEAFTNARPNSDAEDVMKAAIEQANSAIFRMSHDLEQLSTMATTVVALQVTGNIATIGHVGDSRLYRLDGNGNLYRETADHSVVEEEVRAGRMTPAQAANHPSRNVISRALGAESTVEIDMKTIMIDPNTSFLLCSDGITRHIDDYEIRELLNSNQNPSVICEEMKRLCYERGAEDNLTAVIVNVGKQSPAAQSTNGRSQLDIEEQTVANARPAYSNNAFAGAEDENEIPTQNLTMPANAEMQQMQQLQEATEIAVSPAAAAETTKPIVPKFEPAADTKPLTEEMPKRDVITVETEPQKEGGFFGKLLSSLLLLLVGGVLGAGAYYFWLQQNPPVVEKPAPQPVPQSPNIPYTAFEDLRRAVDEAPEKYIASQVNTTQKNGEEFYLLGRAHLLTGNFPEAKKAFDQARVHLAEISTVNSRILENDIETGLIIVNNPYAQEDYKKRLNQKKTETNTNTNTSGANTANSPIAPEM